MLKVDLFFDKEKKIGELNSKKPLVSERSRASLYFSGEREREEEGKEEENRKKSSSFLSNYGL